MTAATCNGACGSGGTLDTSVFVYQPAFDPSNPCTNLVAANNNGCAPLSTVTTNLSSGNFVVVVSSDQFNQTGTYNLNVSTASSGCTINDGPGASCTFLVSPLNHDAPAAGTTFNATVTAGAGCNWTAVSNNPSFIHVTSGASGSGNGTVGIFVDANNGAARTGTLTIAGQTFNVLQEAGAVALFCLQDVLVSSNPTFNRPGTTGACALSGTNTFYKSYEFNLSSCPTASVTANTCGTGGCGSTGSSLDTVVCVYQKSDASGGAFSPSSGCTNLAASNNNGCADGIHSTVTTNVNAGNFVVVVASNGSDQTGLFNLSVTSSCGTLTQVTGGCSFSLNSIEQGFAAAGGATNVTVTAGGGCNWTAVSNDPSFIHVTAGASGSGNGTVGISVDPNSGGPRTGTLTIAGQTFTVTQDPASVSPPCITDILGTNAPAFNRPGTTAPCAPFGVNTFYKAYEFTLSGCATAAVTANTCGTGGCGSAGGPLDTVVYLYQKADASAGAFDPTNVCTNLAASNNNGCADGIHSTVTTNVNAGRFVVVVSTNLANQTGFFNLSVTSACGAVTLPTVTTVTSSANPSNVGQPVIFTATVTATGSTATGMVQFRDGPSGTGAPIGAPVPLANGTASVMTSSLTAGTHGITADYLGNASFNASNGTLAGGQTVINATPLAVGNVLITEFRFHGALGANDEFIELYNNTDAAITIGASGLALRRTNVVNPPVTGTVFTVPAGTVIPARAHFLAVNNTPTTGFTSSAASGYPAGTGPVGNGDAQYTVGVVDGGGIALFNSATIFDAPAKLDAVGFAPGATTPDPLYREGTGLTPAGGVTVNGEYSFARKLANGLPQDTDNNDADFQFVATDAGTYSGRAATLGAAGPESTLSPIQRNATAKASLVEPQQPSTGGQNRVRDTTPNVCNGGTAPSNCTLGTLTIRRKITNTSGATMTRLRFRIVDITTATAAAGTADLRMLDSNSISVMINNTATTIDGTSVETPPAQTGGGGLNASLGRSVVAGTIINSNIAPGASVNVQFVLGVKQGGSYRFLINVEALPGFGAEHEQRRQHRFLSNVEARP